MGRTKVSSPTTSITSLMAATSSRAATRGKVFLPNAECAAKMCVDLVCFWAAKMAGVKFSAIGWAKTSSLTTKTLVTP